MQRTIGWKWRPSLVFAWCALGVSFSAWLWGAGSALADVTRPIPRGNPAHSGGATQNASADEASSESAVVTPKKKSWPSWLPWHRDERPPVAVASGNSSAESPSASKPGTVSRPSSPRGRDRHFPAPQPITDPEVVASVKGAPASAPAKSPKAKKSLLQSLRKPTWLPFTQRDENLADQPRDGEVRSAASGPQPTKVAEYPDVVPPKYRSGGLGGSRAAGREEPTASARPASEPLAGPTRQPPHVPNQGRETAETQPETEASSARAPRDESLPTATPSLVRSFRRPPPDPVPALPDEPNTEVVSANQPAALGASKPMEAVPTQDEIASANDKHVTATDPAVPVMLKSVPPRASNSDQSPSGLHFVPTDFAARERAKHLDRAGQPTATNATQVASTAGGAEQASTSPGASEPDLASTAWTAKRLATTAGAPTATSAASPADSTEAIAATHNTTKVESGDNGSAPGQATWQVNPFAPPPAARLATWPDTGPRRMASRQAIPPAALRPLPAGSAASLAGATPETNALAPEGDRMSIERTPSQVQPLMTTRVSAVEPVAAPRDQSVAAAAAAEPDAAPEPTVVTAANTLEVAEVSDAPETPAVPAVDSPAPESRSSSDPAGSWVDAYRQLMRQNGQTYRRPSAGSPSRRLSSDDQPAAPVRRR